MKATYDQPPVNRPSWANPPKKRRRGCCCLLFIFPVGLLIFLSAWLYLTAPGRTNILILGIDSREAGSDLGRSDTNILTTFIPAEPYIGMLSIPRDLWVSIPGYEANRINVAHFFAEAERPGSGPLAAVDTVKVNFGVDIDFFVRIQHSGFLDLIDALGGIDIYLAQPMSGYTAGNQHLNAEQALALVRDRADSDDYSRMQRGQIFLKALLKELMRPERVFQIPTLWKIYTQTIDTNIPKWRWPQLAFSILRVGPDSIDSRVISREMVSPFTSAGGAYVLAPRWELINPVLLEMFGQ